DAAAHLHDREVAREGVFPRVVAEEKAERPLGEVSVFDLINAFNKVLKRIEEKREDLREIFEENFTVADKIDLILKMTAPGVALKFTELFTDAASRSEVVITFLALLELIRLKQLRCVQPEAFGEIELSRI
ncbi:MAG: segregation/condensation protein A, partial [Chthoniobacteraceae bacterium]